MPLAHIECYLIAANCAQRARDRHCSMPGMDEGGHADFGFPVLRLCLNGDDQVHVFQNAKQATQGQPAYLGSIAQDTGLGTGAIGRSAFRVAGLDKSIARLGEVGVEFKHGRGERVS